MYVTVSVLQETRGFFLGKCFYAQKKNILLYFHPFFYTNEPLCFFQVLKKKINAKMFNTICIVFLGGGCGEIV